MLSRLDTIPERVGQTDGRTDEQTIYQYRASEISRAYAVYGRELYQSCSFRLSVFVKMAEIPRDLFIPAGTSVTKIAKDHAQLLAAVATVASQKFF